MKRKVASIVVFLLFFVGGISLAVWSSETPSPSRYDDTLVYKTTSEFYQIMTEIPMSDIRSITIENTSEDLPSNLSEDYFQIRVEIRATYGAEELPFSHAYSGFWSNFGLWFTVTGIGAFIAFAGIYPHGKKS